MMFSGAAVSPFAYNNNPNHKELLFDFGKIYCIK